MQTQSNISIYILCGGLSTRMQEEKGLVVYKGKTFIKHIIEAAELISPNIFLVTKNEKYKQFEYPLIADIYENKGPVGGIYTALNHSEHKFNLILSCDIPNINSAVLQTYLLQNHGKKAVTYLINNDNEYPLIGVYSKDALPQFKAAIKANKLKLLDLIKSVDYNTITINHKDENAVKNINTKEELEALNQFNS